MALVAPQNTAHFEHKIGAPVYSVLPGDFLVISEPGTAVGTLLGSCVAACIRDRSTGVGGLNHFLLPGSENSDSARYGAYAMELLINEILKAGGARKDLEAKIFGGGEVIESSGTVTVGQKNASFAKDYLQTEGVRILAEDLGGRTARRIYFFPESGKVRVQYLGARDATTAVAREQQYRQRLAQKPKSGSVELF